MADAIPSLPAHLTLEIVTPDRSVVAEKVDEVEIPGAEGYFGVLPGHTPLLAVLKVGELWFRKGSEKFYLSIAFGFAEVLPDRVDEIDVARAEAAKRRAEERIATRAADFDFERARVALLKSLVRLQVATRARTR